MPDAWFNIPEESRPDPDDRGPDFGEVSVGPWWGNRLAASPRYVIRVWAAESALQTLRDRADVDELSENGAVGTLNADAPCSIDSNSRMLRDEP